MSIKRKGEILDGLFVVEDFRELNKALSSGRITLEEYNELFSEDSRKGGLMNTKDGKKIRKIKPFSVGGSDAAIIRKCSPFTSRRMLQLKKLGQVEESVLSSKQFIFDFGHIFESAIGEMCALKLRQKGMNVIFIPCEFGYLHTDWPHFLAHPDGFLIDKDTREIVALVEIKTSASTSHHWQSAFALDIVPEDYNCQVQSYLQVLGLDTAYVFAWNCQREENGFKAIEVTRDEELAISILDDCEKFVKETAAGIEYDDDPLPSEIDWMYSTVDPTLSYAKLPLKVLGSLEELEKLKSERAALNEQIEGENKMLRQIAAQEKALKASLYASIGKAPGGVLDTPKGRYKVDVSRDYSIDAEVKRKAAEEFPEAWEAITSYKPRVSSKVTFIPKEASDESQDSLEAI